MKIPLITTLVFPLAIYAQEIQEDFESYAVGELEINSTWPTAIPQTTPPVFWQTSPRGGKQQIVEREIDGRTGKFYAYAEDEEGQIYTYSHATLPTPCSGSDWTLSVDFYIAAFEEPAVYGVIGVADGSTRKDDYVISVAFSKNSETRKIQVSAQGRDGASFLRGNLEPETWYRLTITGNNVNQTADVVIEGGNYAQALMQLPYAKDTRQFDTLVLGDMVPNNWEPGRANLVYIDNLTLQAKPDSSE